jgi:hypothetical protein
VASWIVAPLELGLTFAYAIRYAVKVPVEFELAVAVTVIGNVEFAGIVPFIADTVIVAPLNIGTVM